MQTDKYTQATSTSRGPGDHERRLSKVSQIPRNPDVQVDEVYDCARMLRVNHAGEYGATRIYAGQMAVLGRLASLEKMAAEEEQHLQLFTDLIIQHNVRPTVLQPLWSVLGFGLGVATAALGERAAHACTIAVEEVIEDHYQHQLNQLLLATSPLAETLRKTIVHCQLEEIAHKEEAVKLGGKHAPLFPVLSGVIKASTRIAIWLSERI